MEAAVYSVGHPLPCVRMHQERESGSVPRPSLYADTKTAIFYTLIVLGALLVVEMAWQAAVVLLAPTPLPDFAYAIQGAVVILAVLAIAILWLGMAGVQWLEE